MMDLKSFDHVVAVVVGVAAAHCGDHRQTCLVGVVADLIVAAVVKLGDSNPNDHGHFVLVVVAFAAGAVVVVDCHPFAWNAEHQIACRVEPVVASSPNDAIAVAADGGASEK